MSAGRSRGKPRPLGLLGTARSRRAKESTKGRDPGTGVTLLPHTRKDPEHLRQTTQQRRGWNSGQGHESGTHVSSCLLIRNLSVCNSSPSLFRLLLVSWCFCFCFFLRPCSLTFHHSSRGRHLRLFSYGNIYLLYISFFLCANLTKCGKPSWSGKRILAKRFRFLSLLARGSGLFLLL